MSLDLNNIKSLSNTVRKRVGRGIGSGTGKTCGRGVKGQKRYAWANIVPRLTLQTDLLLDHTPWPTTCSQNYGLLARVAGGRP